MVDLDAKSNEIEVHLTNGEKMTADLLVGADGHNSTIKNLGYFAESCQESGEMCLGTMNFTVPRQVIEADEELCTLIDHPTHVRLSPSQKLLTKSDAMFSGPSGWDKGIL